MVKLVEELACILWVQPVINYPILAENIHVLRSNNEVVKEYGMGSDPACTFG
jgi:hypothetical protein